MARHPGRPAPSAWLTAQGPGRCDRQGRARRRTRRERHAGARRRDRRSARRTARASLTRVEGAEVGAELVGDRCLPESIVVDVLPARPAADTVVVIVAADGPATVCLEIDEGNQRRWEAGALEVAEVPQPAEAGLRELVVAVREDAELLGVGEPGSVEDAQDRGVADGKLARIEPERGHCRAEAVGQ